MATIRDRMGHSSFMARHQKQLRETAPVLLPSNGGNLAPDSSAHRADVRSSQSIDHSEPGSLSARTKHEAARLQNTLSMLVL